MRQIKDKITWLDINLPKDEDFTELKKHFDLPKNLEDELKIQLSRQKVDIVGDFIFAVIRFPIYSQSKKTSLPVELDFLMKENVIATIRYTVSEPIDDLFKKAEELDGFKNKLLGQTSAEFLEVLFDELFSYAQRELAHVDKKINLITEDIFKGREKEMIKKLSQAKRDILDFRRIIKPVYGVLLEIADGQKIIYTSSKTSVFKRIIDSYATTIDWAENQKDTLDSLEATNSSLLSSKFDEIAKILSWLTFFLAPFTIIGTLFQINAQFTPIVGQQGDWWIIVFLMLISCLGLYIFLKRKKWL